MKSLPSHIQFDRTGAQEYHHNEAERYLTRERHRFLQYISPFERSDEMLLSCPLFCRSRSWSGDYHYRKGPPFLTVTLIHSGEMAFRTTECAGIAEPGDVVFFHARSEYEFMTETACERSGLLLSGPLLAPLLRTTGLAAAHCLTRRDAARTEHLMTMLGAALRESSLQAGQLRISELCFSLLQHFASSEKPVEPPKLLQQVLSEMEQTYHLPLSVEELARKHQITASGLNRMFLKHRKITPYRHLRNLRMNQAARLLETRTFTVKEVAAQVGYENPLNFSTEFRKHFGVSPRAFQG